MPKRNSGARLEWREDRGVWEVIWFERGQRRRRSTGTQDRREAESFLANTIIEFGRDAAGPSDPSQRLVTDAIVDYAEEHGEKVAAPETLGYCISALARFWRGRFVRDVREGTCRSYVEFRVGQGVKDSTAARELAVLGAAIRHDWQAGRLTEVIPVWKPPMPESKDRWLTRAEAAALLRACRTARADQWHLSMFIRLALHTGARAEAILSLRWPQVDLERRLIDFNPPGRGRTKKGRPIIPIPGRLMTPLRAAKRRGSDVGEVIHFRGKPIKSVKAAFGRACARAGLSDVTPHTLRHTCASWLAQSGVSFPVIARFLGHADSSTTERIYAHHAPDYLEAARIAIDQGGRK